MARKTPLSPVQVQAVQMARKGGGRLARWPGGFWTYVGCRYSHTSGDYRVPAEYVPSQTIYALMGRGVLTEIGRDPHNRYTILVQLDEAQVAERIPPHVL